MNICPNFHLIKPDLSPPDAPPALTAYLAALETYQQQRTAKGRTVLFKSYRRWIRAFLDDAAEADRATVNFMVALQNQPSNPKMDAAA